MEDLKTYYIYTLSDPETNIVRYVGCTSNPDVRFKSHINSGKLNRDKYKKEQWIYELNHSGKLPVMTIVYETNNIEIATEMECFYYRIHKSDYLLSKDPFLHPYINQLSHENKKCENFFLFVKNLLDAGEISYRDIFNVFYSSKAKLSYKNCKHRVIRIFEKGTYLNEDHIFKILILLAKKNIKVDVDIPYKTRQLAMNYN